MKKFKNSQIAFLFLITLFTTLCVKSEPDPDKIRQPMVAGSFYPDDSTGLAKMVDGLLSNTIKPMHKGRPIALIAPHAGYIYSGHVAAESYAQLRGRNIERVIVIAPSHVEAFDGASVYDGDGYATPLGTIPVDKDFCNALTVNQKRIKLSSIGHESVYMGRGEHALEVQLPFLQRVIKKFKLVPIIMGEQSYQTCRSLGRALAALIKDEKTIIVASSDLSHFHKYNEAKELDHKLIKAILDWDYYNMVRNLQSGKWEACGGGPVAAAMIASEALGADDAVLLKYANSGDIPNGDKSRVVGYASIGIFKSEQNSKKQIDFSLNEQEKNELLQIAKKSVELYITNKGKYPITDNLPSLQIERGAFVTLELNGRLRGCIGYTAPIEPLIQTVRDVAIQAAVNDPRFPPVQKNDLPILSYEISVLSPFTRVLDVNEIQVGVHGLMMVRENRAGLLLPQVPVEQNWNRTTFLEQTCLKAGLNPNDWKNPDTDIFKFSAFVFNDHKK
jgi:AmmeMemoRadiSam system protein B/AmmeMemoRadiSam system protein A